MNEETEKCLATIKFHNGEFRKYTVAASVGISAHLAAEAGRTGILYLRGEDDSYSIPVRNILYWKVSPWVAGEDTEA